MGPGTIAPTPENYRISLFISEGEKKPFFQEYVQSPVEVRLVYGGGSDRCFYRISGKKGSVILMISSKDDGDFIHYIEIARFLKAIGIGVPRVYDADPEECFLFMEDVGDESLYKKVKRGLPPEEMISWYKMVLEVLVHLQVEGGKHWGDFATLPKRTFDFNALRWETAYFQEHFLEAYCGMKIPRVEALSKEFARLAESVSGEPLHFMHRDFQSQNIMIHNGSVRILDFQGGRRGLLHYDLVSLLKDAYVVLPENVRENLLAFYAEKLDQKGIDVGDYQRFCDVFELTGLQRNMQALGAFSYLSLVKGKTWFKQYVPAGVAYLRAALEKRTDFPVLRSLLEQLPPPV